MLMYQAKVNLYTAVRLGVSAVFRTAKNFDEIMRKRKGKKGYDASDVSNPAHGNAIVQASPVVVVDADVEVVDRLFP